MTKQSEQTRWQQITGEVHTVLGQFMKDREADEILKALAPVLQKWALPIRTITVYERGEVTSGLSTDVGTPLMRGMPGHPDNDMGM